MVFIKFLQEFLIELLETAVGFRRIDKDLQHELIIIIEIVIFLTAKKPQRNRLERPIALMLGTALRQPADNLKRVRCMA